MMGIRRAKPEDAMAIATVHVRSWKAAYPGLIPQEYLDGLLPEHRVAGWEEVLAVTEWPRAGVLLLVEDSSTPDEERRTGPGENVTGFSHICPTRDDDLDPTTTGEVTSIYLAPEAWGSGNGVALLGTSIDQMVAAGYETATLWALDTNARARRFYEIGGWELDGAKKLHDWGTFVCTDVRYLLDLRGRKDAKPADGVMG
jgi:GNAT superfamily N-acetyltransferase